MNAKGGKVSKIKGYSGKPVQDDSNCQWSNDQQQKLMTRSAVYWRYSCHIPPTQHNTLHNFSVTFSKPVSSVTVSRLVRS